jgi:hypothetical protein
MDDMLVRLLVVGGAAAVVLLLALATRRWQRPSHPPVALDGLTLPNGIVIFTSTDCTTCKEALVVVKAVDAPVREVTWELEPNVLEAAQVTAVPLTLVRAEDGTVIDQIVGVPRLRRLSRAVQRWERSAAG